MNEFIVWDKEKHIFVPQGEIIFSFYGDNKIVVTPNCIEYIGDTCHDNYNENRFNIFNHIGLKDINGKSIYADSSIVEFFDHKLDYFKGYFTFNIRKLAYEIIIFSLNEGFRDVITYCKDDITNIRIIDTIQENKLGLI